MYAAYRTCVGYPQFPNCFHTIQMHGNKLMQHYIKKDKISAHKCHKFAQYSHSNEK